jgi:hypothetical protein
VERTSLAGGGWSEAPRGTWHRLGWVVAPGGLGFQAFEPGSTVRKATFVGPDGWRRGRAWVDRQIAQERG